MAEMTRKAIEREALRGTFTSCPLGRPFEMMGLALVLSLLPACHTPQREDRAALVGCLWHVSPGTMPGTLDLNTTELDALQALGMNTVVLNGPLIGQPLSPGAEDPALKLFQEGDRRGLRFFVDTLSLPDWWVQSDPAAEITRARERIRLLHARYSHFKSFHGFYVPYEVYVMWGAQRQLTHTVYREAAAVCKTVAPAKPVLISPFFILDQQGVLGDFRWATPDEYQAFWTEVLRDTPADIVALQDRGEHLSYYTDSQCAPFFAAMKNACAAAGRQLWANVETGELDVAGPEDYTARFGRKTHVNDPKTQSYWRGVPADKLAAKLRFVRGYTPTAITWGYREFVRPSLGPTSAALHDDYRARLASPTQHASASYRK
jgi:hypothetical protein